MHPARLKKPSPHRKRQGGFSLTELLFVALVGMILAGIAIPKFMTMASNLRSSGDANNINSAMILARMRAAADFSQARLHADLSGRTFRVEVWNKSGAGSWVTEGGTQSLSLGVNFGAGSLSTAPPNTQATLAQASACRNSSGTSIANTACVVFNSRGIPVDSTGAPTADDAIYLNDGKSAFGVTVGPTGLVRTWRTDSDTANWKKR